MRKIYLFCLACAISTHVAHSQDSLSATTLHEVVISAARAEQPVIETPRSVTVIHGSTIRESVYQSVGELLNMQSGIFISGANQTPGTNQNIFMRGANSNQVAVLIDGVRVTDPTSPNAAIDLSEISIANVERIEVIRGSHSTIFGGAAVGGVINIITKGGSTPGLHGDVSWQGGSFGNRAGSSTESANIGYGLTNGLYVTGSVFRQDVAGLNSSEMAAVTPSFSADKDDFRKMDASLKAGYSDQDWKASITYKNTHQYTEIDKGAFADDDNNYLVFDRGLLQYAAERIINSKFRLSVGGSCSNSERFYEDDSSKVDAVTWDKAYSTGTYYGRLQTHEVQANYTTERLKTLFGAGLYREKMFFDNYFFYNDPAFPYELTTNYDTINARTTTGYLFGRVDYGFGKMHLAAGGRLSRHTTAGNFATFEINPSYLLNEWLIYGSVSTGFNAPSLYQLFDPAKSFSAFTSRGNRALKPERSVSLEVGIKKQFPSGSYFTLSAYETSVSNSIEYAYLWNGEKQIDQLDYSDDRGDTYVNVGEQRVHGIEGEAFIQMSKVLSVQGNVSLLQSQVRATPNDIDRDHTGGHHVQLYNLGRFLDGTFEDDQVVRRPGLTAFGRLSYEPASRVRLDLFYRFTGDRFDAGYDGTLGPYGAIRRFQVDAYHLLDAGVSIDASKQITLALKVENILNEAYRELAGFQTRGRSLYLKVAARF